MLTPEQFHYAFTNTLSDDESKKLYDRYAIAVRGSRALRRRLRELRAAFARTRLTSKAIGRRFS